MKVFYQFTSRCLAYVVCLSLIFFNIPQANATKLPTSLEKKQVQLINKIAKGYSSKFCNAIGIGVSKEGALVLAINENKKAKFNPSLWSELLLSGKKNMTIIDQDEINESIAAEIILTCGKAIGYSGEKGKNEFKDYFLSTKQKLDQ